jgi:hypothetical protein
LEVFDAPESTEVSGSACETLSRYARFAPF